MKTNRAATLFLLFGSVAPAQPVNPDTGVIGVSNFGHIVKNLDKSYAFYRDLLQLDPAVPPQTFAPNPAIMKTGNTIGAQSRIGVLKVPGAGFGLELIEYKDIDRRPASLRNQDPGTGNLTLFVKDIDATLDRLRQGGARTELLGLQGVLNVGRLERAYAQDPDGFFVTLVRNKPVQQSIAPATSNVIGGLIAVTVTDTDSAVRLYHDVLGFEPGIALPYTGDGNWMGPQSRTTALQIPGTQVSIWFPQFKDIDRKPLHTRLQDPGTALLQLEVRNVDGMVKAVKAAGVEVISVGGEPVDVQIPSGPKLRIAIVRDPNNLFLELIQR